MRLLKQTCEAIKADSLVRLLKQTREAIKADS